MRIGLARDTSHYYIKLKRLLAFQRLVVAAVFVLTMVSGCVAVNTNVSRDDRLNQGLATDQLSPEQLPLNYFQFFGSHNSYKTAISDPLMDQLRALNPKAALALEYWHEPLADQLDLGVRVLELDVFYDPEFADPAKALFGQGGAFPVLHVQNLDTGSHCAHLAICMEQILSWARHAPGHEPLLISFNAKTQEIDYPGLVKPKTFDRVAWQDFDALLNKGFGARLLKPAQVLSPNGPVWPSLAESRGKVLLLLDEGEEKFRDYLAAVARPALFVNASLDDTLAAIQVLNDPVGDADEIAEALDRGLLVRTRADADTVEARAGDSSRRDAAFASGAQFVSTDYYLPSRHFHTDYVVALPEGGSIRCNPVTPDRRARKLCQQAQLLLKK